MRFFALLKGAVRALGRLVGRAWRTVLALVLMVALVTAFVRDLYYFPRSASWQQTKAEVLESSFERGDDDFAVDFKYRYAVDGVTYEGERITFFQYAVFANAYQNQRFIGQHPVGATVDIYYDPQEPGRAVIMRVIPLSQLWSPVLLVLCLASVFVSAVLGAVLRRLMRAWRGAQPDHYEGWLQGS